MSYLSAEKTDCAEARGAVALIIRPEGEDLGEISAP